MQQLFRLQFSKIIQYRCYNSAARVNRQPIQNEAIGKLSDSVYLINDRNEKVGPILLQDALLQTKANGPNMNLQQVSRVNNMPLCRIIAPRIADVKEKPKPSAVKIKEVELKTVITEHDLQVKIKQLKQWLEKGYHVKASIIYKAGGEDRQTFLERFCEEIKSFASFPQGFGKPATSNQRRRPKNRTSVVLLVPKPVKQ